MTPEKPSAEILKYIVDYFQYNPLTGVLYRFSKKYEEFRPCANPHDSNRYRVGIWYRTYYVANICWFLHYKEWPDVEIDHADGDGYNNKIDNLRKSGYSANSANKDNRKTNKYHGVSYHSIGDKWRYRFRIDKKQYEVYGFQTALDAARAREKHLDELGDKFCPRNKV